MLGYMIPIIGFGVYLIVVIVIFIKRWNEEVAEAKKFEEKEKAFTKLIQEAADSQGCLFVEDSGEGHDMELNDIYLEDVSGWLVPKGTPEEQTHDAAFYCFAEWELDEGKIIIRFNKHVKR